MENVQDQKTVDSDQIDFGKFVEKASAGVVSHFENDYTKQRDRMDEFLAKQTQVLNLLDSELVKMNMLENLPLKDMMQILKTCQTRLQTIKERMKKASTKAARLKERSLKIQQIKQKEALERELRREAQLTREQEMVKTSSMLNLGADRTSKSEKNPSQVNLSS